MCVVYMRENSVIHIKAHIYTHTIRNYEAIITIPLYFVIREKTVKYVGLNLIMIHLLLLL